MKAFFQLILNKPLYNIFILIVALMPSHNVGLAIIVLTILVHLALGHLKYRSMVAQMKQKELQPELKALQDKYKDDRTAQSQAMMQLYRDKGVNPASGCLIQLIQFPILIGLYLVFRQGVDIQHHQNLLYSFIQAPESINTTFLWVKDITKPDHTFILPILVAISQFLFSRSLMKTLPQTGGPNDMSAIMGKQMTYFFPIILGITARSFPAGLSIYWVVATLFSWWQQHQGMKRYEAQPKDKVSVSVRQKKKETTS